VFELVKFLAKSLNAMRARKKVKGDVYKAVYVVWSKYGEVKRVNDGQ